jgi:hypothetical protein
MHIRGTETPRGCRRACRTGREAGETDDSAEPLTAVRVQVVGEGRGVDDAGPAGNSGSSARTLSCPRLASSAIAADGSILRSVIGRTSWRQWRAVARLLLLDFGGELPKQTGRERPHVEGLPRFEFELLRLLVARAVEHRLGDANRQARCSGCASSASSTRWKTSSAGCSPALRRSTAFFCTCGAAPP